MNFSVEFTPYSARPLHAGENVIESHKEVSHGKSNGPQHGRSQTGASASKSFSDSHTTRSNKQSAGGPSAAKGRDKHGETDEAGETDKAGETGIT